MKVTPFTRDLLKAYREERAKDTFDLAAIQAARKAMKSNEPDARHPLLVTKQQAERLGMQSGIEIV